jgi:ribose transport system substrate-binding protein
MQDPDGYLTEQTKQLENYISRKGDGIIVVPIDSEASADEIKMVNDAGIPVITIDIAATGGGEVLSHIASDNYLGGVLAAEFLGDQLGGTGKVALINNPTITPLIDRENGYQRHYSGKNNPDIEIVSTQSANPRVKKAWGRREHTPVGDRPGRHIRRKRYEGFGSAPGGAGQGHGYHS